jgi:ParB family transcriptional regulator, chromosome partitioning protein
VNTDPRRIYAIPLALIDVGERLRPVDQDFVALIAASMAERGQDTPITVAEAGADGRHRLIAGGHRVAAAQSLGWEKIDARISDADELQAKLQEIDENLIRRELSALDRAVFLAERKSVYEALNPGAKRGGDRRSTKATSLSVWSEAFAKATAEKLGVDARTVERAVRRAQLPADIRAAIATHPIADSGAELDKLLSLPVERQRAVVEALIRGEKAARNVSAALAEISGPAANSRAAETAKHFGALMSAWRKAGKPARGQFLDFLASEGEIPERPAKPTSGGGRRA